MRKEVAQKIATIVKLPYPWTFVPGDGKSKIKSQECVNIHLIIKDVTVFHQIIAVDELADELIVGADALQRWKIRLDPETEDVLIDKKVRVSRGWNVLISTRGGVEQFVL